MFLLFANMGTLDYTGHRRQRGPALPRGGAVVTAICLFLFLGCTGKSAQIPLYVWLPDAMAGPTPVSALIHAATMVTAGVYLVARSVDAVLARAGGDAHRLRDRGGHGAVRGDDRPQAVGHQEGAGVFDRSRSSGTCSSASASGAYAAGIFHLVTHAFFKALLFLGAGSVIYAMHAAYHETHNRIEDAQDMRNMGGLRRSLPVTWVLMWIATLAIAGIPLFSGFFSKDEILGTVFERAQGSTLSQRDAGSGIPGEHAALRRLRASASSPRCSPRST